MLPNMKPVKPMKTLLQTRIRDPGYYKTLISKNRNININNCKF